MKNLPTMPDRNELRALYDNAISEINPSRNNLLTTPFYDQTGNIIFDAGCRALADAVSNTRQMITVPAPVGAGKVSFAFALIAAVARHAEQHPDAPYGCALVVEQIKQAEKAFRELKELLPWHRRGLQPRP